MQTQQHSRFEMQTQQHSRFEMHLSSASCSMVAVQAALAFKNTEMWLIFRWVLTGIVFLSDGTLRIRLLVYLPQQSTQKRGYV
jgi:hypothetical protein